MQAREYQHLGVNKLVAFIKQGYKRIVFQLPTGGGKTICFSYFLQRYFKAYPDTIAKTLVHRQELQEQTLNTFKHFHIDNVPVFMVETFNNRIKKGEYLATQIIIIDECHIGNFRKIFEHFPNATIIGFSATPLSSSKKHPLNMNYEVIVTTVGIKELIELWKDDHTTGLVPARHYSPETDLNKSNITIKAGRYDEKEMGIEFSKPKLIDAAYYNYKLYSEGKKTLVFNTTIEHNELVNTFFKEQGVNTRTIDSENVTEEQRKEIFQWFRETPGAVLMNIGIATTGYDEPSIENIVVNRLTLSLPLWHQMCGRGGRPYLGKLYFNIIDLGGNTATLGRWDEPIDWEEKFYYPSKPGKGIAPMKICPNLEVPIEWEGNKILTPEGTPLYRRCGCMIYMAATVCPYCGYLMPRDVVYSDLVVHLKLVPDTDFLFRNAPISHDKYVKKVADKITILPGFTREDKVGLLEQSIQKINKQSDIRMSSNLILHTANKNIPL